MEYIHYIDERVFFLGLTNNIGNCNYVCRPHLEFLDAEAVLQVLSEGEHTEMCPALKYVLGPLATTDPSVIVSGSCETNLK